MSVYIIEYAVEFSSLDAALAYAGVTRQDLSIEDEVVTSLVFSTPDAKFVVIRVENGGYRVEKIVRRNRPQEAQS